MFQTAAPQPILDRINETFRSLDRKLLRRDTVTRQLVGSLRRDLERLAANTWALLREADERTWAAHTSAREANARADSADHEQDRQLAAALRAGDPDGFDPNGPHVYVLWGDHKTTPLYVGLSTSILVRLGAHLGDPDKRRQVRRVQIVRCRDLRAMAVTEARLIGAYRPTWNVMFPSVRSA